MGLRIPEPEHRQEHGHGPVPGLLDAAFLLTQSQTLAGWSGAALESLHRARSTSGSRSTDSRFLAPAHSAHPGTIACHLQLHFADGSISSGAFHLFSSQELKTLPAFLHLRHDDGSALPIPSILSGASGQRLLRCSPGLLDGTAIERRSRTPLQDKALGLLAISSRSGFRYLFRPCGNVFLCHQPRVLDDACQNRHGCRPRGQC